MLTPCIGIPQAAGSYAHRPGDPAAVRRQEAARAGPRQRRALRIFKAETKGLIDDDDDDDDLKTPEQREIEARQAEPPPRGTESTPVVREQRDEHHQLTATRSSSVSLRGVVQLFAGKPAPSRRRRRPDGAVRPPA